MFYDIVLSGRINYIYEIVIFDVIRIWYMK